MSEGKFAPAARIENGDKRIKGGSKVCRANVPKFYTSNAVIDNRGGGSKNIYFFKKYPAGFVGLCDWYARLQKAILSGLRADMYQRGNLVMLRLTYRPQVQKDKRTGEDGPKTKLAVLQQMVVRFNKAGRKIAGIDNYFDNHLVWDEFFDIDRATKRTPMQFSYSVPLSNILM